MDLFDIDFHIFKVIKFLFNLGVRIKYIYIHVKYYIIIHALAIILKFFIRNFFLTLVSYRVINF